MFSLFWIFMKAAAGALAALPFLILLEILAARSIPKLPLPHSILDAVLAAYLGAVLSITGIPALYELRLSVSLNLIPFADLFSNAVQYGENVLLFVPLGFLLPFLFTRYQKLLPCLRAGFLLSLGIEVMQLFSFRATDIDDLLMNTLGTLAGFLLFRLLRRFHAPAAEAFSLSAEEMERLPALFELEAPILFSAAWAGALLLTPAIENVFYALFL